MSYDLARHGTAFWIKWGASVLPIFGDTATGFGLTRWNDYLSIFGLYGRFAVGVPWNDRAIMLIHFVAFGSMMAGLLST